MSEHSPPLLVWVFPANPILALPGVCGGVVVLLVVSFDVGCWLELPHFQVTWGEKGADSGKEDTSNLLEIALLRASFERQWLRV